ncbi:MAG: hypothetical protein IKU20_07875 [Lachnospiraceae bacterium]|nr:hypothetical protein [Lachnospiraceae bacterium]
MRVEKENKRRLCVMVSDVMDNRLESDSVKYGISKSDIIRVALIDYYRKVDNNE